MSHTFNASKGAIFNYNPDLSGEVYIRNDDGECIEIAGTDLVDFIVNNIETRIADIPLAKLLLLTAKL